ncbi:actin-related protein 8 isoform X8 [Rhipicephalus sanguineus]|uniref:actin-related protein 8 isoform X6 n=1 Tax=Rhipicephalus sanguineus TaxID=34632 RepID=UPI001894DDD2|nr:actin-related protein 8 isoform X6 [Rhipicephalus sanguineus]XP_049269519.1 actin-related protein 8 isoform X2 [Rhipicephalus sanguineus]XP_049269520.1 actin-related protein 8 isoform X3 [Rhipicephalus sanguineus]XP_049269521.1 actin-related protein 8 isoform X4 [Rhipicephalus sanguineus]XP_049269522.1 actin-related protein 8 isoform X5 [Rhipicephalus sanguineus]XP_049269523.1 actin-related protein 8 isoform X7 [Rhipicephalus sanguineus]XP_049269524.1 actin-related protein 8 isoform X8 [Rh
MAPTPPKKQPVSIFPEPSVEPIQATAIVIIHPGSMFLRIGRASDSYPHTIPHVIARPCLSETSAPHVDPILVPEVDMEPEVVATIEEGCEVVGNLLASCLTSEGRIRYTFPTDKIHHFNQHVKPTVIEEKCDLNWTNTDRAQEFFIGEEVLYLNPEQRFHVHWPIRRGRLNVHSGVGGSLVSVLAHLEAIWGMAIQQYLEIPLKDLKHYRAVLVIPDVHARDHVRELVQLLLCKLGFGGCFVALESVCATFGAGLCYACVVDVGDQKTSVSCVEDGISSRTSRLTMEYGGADITHLFHYLLRKSGFPYKECDPTKVTDAMLLQELKENMCHVNLDICGAQERSFQVKQPGKPLFEYKIKVGDECLVAPLALFRPDMLGVTGPKQSRGHPRNPGDPHDPLDEHFLLQTQRRAARDVAEGSQASDATSQLDDSQLGQGALDEDEVVPPEAVTLAAAPRDSERELPCDQLLGIDQAIVQCVDRCDGEELKRKMFSCVLVVGGGCMFPGIHTWLQNRLSVQIPIMYRPEQMEIITRPRDTDPRITTWKGASIMSCLDSAQELWIRQAEWQRYGVRLLRERAPFNW